MVPFFFRLKTYLNCFKIKDMKIIKLDDTLYDLTVDTTYVTCDSTIITCDATVYESDKLRIRLVPRILPNEGDELIVKLRNEITDEIIQPEFYFNFIDNYFNLYFDRGEFKNGDKFEIEILRAGVYIYKGKALLRENEDIQNYRKTIITNNKLKF